MEEAKSRGSHVEGWEDDATSVTCHEKTGRPVIKGCTRRPMEFGFCFVKDDDTVAEAATGLISPRPKLIGPAHVVSWSSPFEQDHSAGVSLVWFGLV